MSQKNIHSGRRRKYHVKPAGMILLGVLALMLILIIVIACTKIFGGTGEESSLLPASQASSGLLSAAGGEPESSISVSSDEDSSEPEPTSDTSSGVLSEASFEGSSDTAASSEPDTTSLGGVPYGNFGVGEITFTPSDSGELSFTTSEGSFKAGEVSFTLSDWNLILLNPEAENKIDQDMDIQMTKFDSQWVDSRAAAAYQAMYDAAQEKGITLFLRSGYRSIPTQRTNFNNNYQSLLDQGYSEEEALRQTKMYYTEPGHSEHHTGLAFDLLTPEYHTMIYRLDERFTQTDAYPWLIENCADYGFVLRYPKDKEAITQISYEPWHYRYVGVEHAKFMKKYNLCLEEYIALLKQMEVNP